MKLLGNTGGFIATRQTAIGVAASLTLGGSAWAAVNVPYFSDSYLATSDTTLSTGGGGTSAWTTSGGTLTTARLPGALSGPFFVTGPTDANRNSTATLNLSGITPGLQYQVYFSLVTIGDWTGGSGGDDLITVKFNPTSETALTYVNATFSNTTGNNQSYSNSTPLGGANGSLSPATGADATGGTVPDSATNLGTNDYAVYYFGYGANAGFTFTTTAATTGTLTFQFSGLGSGANWQIGNVIVNVPEMTSTFGLSVLASLALGGIYLRNRRTLASVRLA